MQSVEHPRLLVDVCFRGIDVLRGILGALEQTTAKGNDPPPAIEDGHDDAPTKQVVAPTPRIVRIPEAGQTSQDGLIKCDSERVEGVDKAVPFIRRIADLKLLDALVGDPPLVQVVQRLLPIRRGQQVALEVLQRGLTDLMKPGTCLDAAQLVHGEIALGQGHTGLLGELFGGFIEAEAAGFLHEGEDVATFTTPEAVKDPLGRHHREARALLLMEWTQPHQTAAHALEGHHRGDHLPDVDPLTKLFDDFSGNPHCIPSLWVAQPTARC